MWRKRDAIAKRLVDVYDVSLDEHLSHQIISIAGRAGTWRTPEPRSIACEARARWWWWRTRTTVCWAGTRAGDWDGAEAALDELVAAHLRPDTYTYAHLVSAAERAGRYAEADEVWQRALASKIKPHTVMCGGVVHCLGCQGRWMEAEALVAQMREKWGARRNAAVYNALLGALVRAEKLDKALRAFDQMQSGEAASSRRRSRSCSSCARARKTDSAPERRNSPRSGTRWRRRARSKTTSRSTTRTETDTEMDPRGEGEERGRLSAGLPPRR